MLQRTITAIIGLPVVLAALWFGLPWLSVFVAVTALLALLEFASLAKSLGAAPATPVMVVWGLAYIADAHFGGGHGQMILAAGVPVSLLWQTLVVWSPAGAAMGIRPRSRSEAMATFVTGWGLTVVGPLYIGFTLAQALLIRSMPGGREWLLLVIAVIFATDTFAYFTGKLVGHTKLAPSISPGKTWEGAIGGLVGAIVVGVVVSKYFTLPIATWQAVALSGSIAVVAQLGDLAESMLKRAAGTKESGGLLPGHGGILDRLDSIVVSLVVAYYALTWILP